MKTTVVVVADDGRIFKVDRDMTPTKGWGGEHSYYEVYGKQWDDRRDRWAKEDNLYYVNGYTITGEASK